MRISKLACMALGYRALLSHIRLCGEELVCGDKAALCGASLGVAPSFRLLGLGMASAKSHEFFVDE
jgi:hypothetical protein